MPISRLLTEQAFPRFPCSCDSATSTVESARRLAKGVGVSLPVPIRAKGPTPITRMKHSERNSRKPISLGNLRATSRSVAAAFAPDPALSVISPKEALGQLIQMEPYARKYFGQLVVLNWCEHPASRIVDADTLSALRCILGVRTFDSQHLALSPRDPFAVLECLVDGSDIDQVEVQPSARGLALVEALLTGEDVSY